MFLSCHIISRHHSKRQLHLRQWKLFWKKTHFQTKWVIKEDIFTACTDYRDSTADAENLWFTPEDWNSLNSYDSLWIHTHIHTQPMTYFLCLNGSHGGSSSVVPAPTPAHTSTSAQSSVHLWMPQAHHHLTIRARNTRPHNPLYKVTLTLITSECLPRLP